MTNEQAKTIIESCDGIMWNRLTDAENEALYMAIEALSNNKKQTDSLIRTSTDSVSATDVIYRADAIDALKRLQKDITGDYMELDPLVMAGCGYIGDCIGELENLPSAQPETCEGCKHLGKWENEVEYRYPSPCTRCKRRVKDNYER